MEELLTHNPCDPDNTALEAAMPQSLWGTLLWDVAQGHALHFGPVTLRRWLQTTHPQAWAIGEPQASPPPHTRAWEKERAEGRPSAKGQGKAQGEGSTPTEEGAQRPPQE